MAVGKKYRHRRKRTLVRDSTIKDAEYKRKPPGPNALWLKLNVAIKTARLQSLKRNKYQHLQEEAILKARGLLQNWEDQPVVLTEDLYHQATRTGESDADELENYTPEALAFRFSLRNDPDILDAAREIWNISMPRDELGRINERSYTALFKRIAKSLKPESYKKSKVSKTIAQDWRRDSRGQSHIGFADFFDSIFELADLWCESIDVDEYVSFLGDLMKRVSRGTKDGKRVFRAIAQVGAIDEDFESSSEEESESESESEEDEDEGETVSKDLRMTRSTIEDGTSMESLQNLLVAKAIDCHPLSPSSSQQNHLRRISMDKSPALLPPTSSRLLEHRPSNVAMVHFDADGYDTNEPCMTAIRLRSCSVSGIACKPMDTSLDYKLDTHRKSASRRFSRFDLQTISPNNNATHVEPLTSALDKEGLSVNENTREVRKARLNEDDESKITSEEGGEVALSRYSERQPTISAITRKIHSAGKRPSTGDSVRAENKVEELAKSIAVKAERSLINSASSDRRKTKCADGNQKAKGLMRNTAITTDAETSQYNRAISRRNAKSALPAKEQLFQFDDQQVVQRENFYAPVRRGKQNRKPPTETKRKLPPMQQYILSEPEHAPRTFSPPPKYIETPAKEIYNDFSDAYTTISYGKPDTPNKEKDGGRLSKGEAKQNTSSTSGFQTYDFVLPLDTTRKSIALNSKQRSSIVPKQGTERAVDKRPGSGGVRYVKVDCRCGSATTVSDSDNTMDTHWDDIPSTRSDDYESLSLAINQSPLALDLKPQSLSLIHPVKSTPSAKLGNANPGKSSSIPFSASTKISRQENLSLDALGIGQTSPSRHSAGLDPSKSLPVMKNMRGELSSAPSTINSIGTADHPRFPPSVSTKETYGMFTSNKDMAVSAATLIPHTRLSSPNSSSSKTRLLGKESKMPISRSPGKDVLATQHSYFTDSTPAVRSRTAPSLSFAHDLVGFPIDMVPFRAVEMSRGNQSPRAISTINVSDARKLHAESGRKETNESATVIVNAYREIVLEPRSKIDDAVAKSQRTALSPEDIIQRRYQYKHGRQWVDKSKIEEYIEYEYIEYIPMHIEDTEMDLNT